jgi:transposase
MAMGKRWRRAKQTSIWVATQDLPRTVGQPFYTRLNRILDNADFDGYVEPVCQRFYANEIGRPGLPPGRYFRLLLIGYFEGLDAERAIAWRAADSFALREFLGLVLPAAPPDHSTISRTRRLIDLETHEAVFTWILQRLADAGLVKGKTIGIDATTLEANAALRSIVRRDTGAAYQEFLTQLAQASGIDTPTREDLARIDRKRPKKGSNDDWTHPLDPDAKITKMKDGRTHLAHKAEHAVDLETGAVVAVTVQDADEGDTATSIDTLIDAAEQVETVVPDGEIEEVVADKGYHSNQVMVDLEAVGVRSYISEPDRGRRRWKDNPDARNAVYCNRRRIRGARGKRLPVARRAIGTAVRASVRNGSDASRASARSRQHSQTAAGACRRAESRVTDAHAVRRRDTTRPPGPSRGAACDGLVASVASSNRLHVDRVPRRVSDCPDRLPKGSRRTRNRSCGRAVFCHGLLGHAPQHPAAHYGHG